ncbi:SRPBCC family protein [Streptomyces sp. NPDC050560]|uniref:SRPBCC family protein n=1 Tax=Streptomyces sp. NPDC050560 TaxID=3365630 RepID=UPI00378A2AA9
MELQHAFTVPVPVDEAWRALLDIERVAPCMPGATVEDFDGTTVTGRVKVKVGPVTVTYRGTAVFEERDAAGHRMVLAASGKETRGQGTARATVTGTLTEADGGTRVAVSTNLAVTGRPAQFGRGVMADVGERVLGQFAACLARRLGPQDEPRDAEPASEPRDARPSPGPRDAHAPSEPRDAVPAQGREAGPVPAAPGPEPLDLLGAAAVPLAKRAALPALGAAIALAVFTAVRRRRRRRR